MGFGGGSSGPTLIQQRLQNEQLEEIRKRKKEIEDTKRLHDSRRLGRRSLFVAGRTGASAGKKLDPYGFKKNFRGSSLI